MIGFNLYKDGLAEISNYIAYMLIFNVAVILITSRVEVGNDLLCFFGKYLFPLYIFQRISMLILQNEGIINNIVFFIVAGLATIIALFTENFVLSKINNLIYRSK